MKTKFFISFLLFFSCISVFSQTYTLNAASNNTTITTCSGTFHDSGGPGTTDGNYGNDEDYTITFCSANGGALNFYFEYLDLELNWDYLSIYDGSSTAATEIAGSPFTNNDLTGVNVTSTGPCITFNFDSDLSVVRPGWEAIITCFTPCQNVQGNLTTVSPPPNPISGAVEICQGDNIEFGAQGIYPENDDVYNQSDATSTFSWNFGDGSGATGTSVDHVFSNEGIYNVVLEITDINGCTNTNAISQMVYVSTTPSFAGTNLLENEICLGSQNELTGDVNTVTSSISCENTYAAEVFLPDGNGNSYSSPITLDCYGAGNTLTDINDLEGICLNIEHSFVGDLSIVISCPNGQSVSLLDDTPGFGSGADLGIPGVGTAAGTGYDYCFTNSPTYGILTSDQPGTSQPAGDYASDNPLTGLLGCPLNGDWILSLTDNAGGDDGYLFSWQVNLDPSLLVAAAEFTPTIITESWVTDPSIISTTGNVITVEPTVSGNNCYTYEITDDFGCMYDTTLCFNVIESSSNLQIDPVPVLCESQGVYSVISNTTMGVWSGDVNPDGTFEPSVGSGDYTGTLTLGGGTICEVSETVNITVGTGPSAVLSGSNSICPGDSAQLQIDYTGSALWTFEYAIDGIPQGVLTSTVNPFLFYTEAPGTYTLISFSDPNCIGTISGSADIVISDSPQISNVVETCSADLLTYTISFDITGGDLATYDVLGAGTISGSTFVSDPIANGGNYDFTVSDANNCGADNVNGSFNCGCAATATISGNEGMCVGGSATLSVVFEGVGPWTFSYALEGDIVGTETTIDNPYLLSVNSLGNYTLLDVEDVNCFGSVFGSADVYLFETPQISNVIETCSTDLLTYTISFDITGGEAGTYNVVGGGIITGSTFVSDPIANGSTYDFTVSDANNCGTDNVNGSFNCGCAATATISGNEGMCVGGSATLTVVFEGVGPWTFSYELDGDIVGTETTSDNPYLLSVNTIGNYTLFDVVDANCVGSVSGTADVYLFETPQTSNVVEICSTDLLSYTVSFEITGGDVSTYNVVGAGTVTGSSFISDPIANGSTYDFAINDGNNCGSDNVSGVVDCGCLASATISGNVSLCDGTSGITQIDFAGIGPWTFNYSIDGLEQGFETVTDNPYFLPVTSPGEYVVTSVEDANCFGQTFGTMEVSETISPTGLFVEDISFCVGEVGTLIIELTGEGPWDVIYAINGVDQDLVATSDNFIEILCSQSGSYSITSISDENCTSTTPSTATVTVNELPEATIGGSVTICENEPSALVVELTGTPGFNLTYSIDGIEQEQISTTETGSFEFLVDQTGTYELLTVEDMFCAGNASGTTIVEIAPLPTGIISGDFTICDGQQQLIPIVLTGEPDWEISYTIDGFDQTAVTTSTSPFYLPAVASGIYVITSIEDNFCTNEGEGFAEINYYPPIAVDFSPDASACIGEEASIWASASGGIGAPYNYNWDSEYMTTAIDSVVNVLSNENISVTLTVTDLCEYTNVTNIPVVIHQLPPISISGTQNSCGPEFIQINNTTPSSYVGDSCLWIIDDDSIYNCNSNMDYYFSEPGFYNVSLAITSPEGCYNSVDFDNYFEVFPLPTAEFTFSPTEPDIINSEVHFNNESSEDVEFISWSFGDEDMSTDASPSFIFPTVNGPDNWLVCLNVENDYGCLDSLCEMVVVKPGLLSHIPNSFSPDGDGLNEFFFPVLNGVDADDYEFRIYDRIGNVVFKTNDINGKWNGSNLGKKDYFVKDGFYNWQISAKLIGSADKELISGSVLLLR